LRHNYILDEKLIGSKVNLDGFSSHLDNIRFNKKGEKDMSG